jgi:transcriptional regulator with XRE-family HTH domain
MYQDYEQRRAFASEIIEAAFFGAFMVAIDARKNEENLTQAELAKRTGREKTGISKLLAGPRNWKLSTISDLAEALDLRLEFVLVDQHFPQRRFTQTGVAFIPPENGPSNASQWMMPINNPQGTPAITNWSNLEYKPIAFMGTADQMLKPIDEKKFKLVAV